MNRTCPVCASQSNREFFSVKAVPVYNARLYRDPQESLAIAKGDISLLCCDRCSMIWNADFDPELVQYDHNYEETQGYSPAFDTFHRGLAQSLFDSYALQGKSVIEIGSGKGEFLLLLEELGIGRGTGFDPVVDTARIATNSKIKFRKEFFPPADDHPEADFYCCKMTLEHIHQPGEFIRALTNYIGHSPESILFFQLPSANLIIKEFAFWDIYYEHCNYFTKDALRYLFEANGFVVQKIDTMFDDQYLGLVASPGNSGNLNSPGTTVTQTSESIDADHFFEIVRQRIDAWENFLLPFTKNNRLLIWGAASKAVALISVIDALRDNCRLVDINPHKQGTWLPGTGLKIESPEAIRNQDFDLVLVANPVYLEEVNNQLKALSVSARVCPLASNPPEK